MQPLVAAGSDKGMYDDLISIKCLLVDSGKKVKDFIAGRRRENESLDFGEREAIPVWARHLI